MRIELEALMLTARVVVLAIIGAGQAVISAQQPVTTSTPLVFDEVTVVDVEHGKLLPDQRVVVAGNHIQVVGSARSVTIPEGAQVVDARSKYLIPGLWDLHVHPGHSAPNFFYPLLLANGVTGLRDPGSVVPLDTLLLWRQEIAAGVRIGPPRQLLSGKYISEEGRNGVRKPCIRSQQKTQQTCVSSKLADAHHLVDSLKAAGADMIKIYNVSRDMYFALAAKARRLSVPFTGHIYPWVRVSEASDSGLKIFDHRGNGNRTGELDSLCVQNTADVGMCQSVAERFRKNGTWWVPTLIGLNQGGPASRHVITSLAKFSREFMQSDTVLYGNLNRDLLSSNTDHSSDLIADSLNRLFRIMQLVDFPILAGTDIGGRPDVRAGFSLHGELAMYVAEGLTPLSALQAATLNPARMLNGTDSLGTVAPGKLADLVLLDANPLADITNTMKIRAVVANGRYFDRRVLDQLLIEVKAKTRRKPFPE